MRRTSGVELEEVEVAATREEAREDEVQEVKDTVVNKSGPLRSNPRMCPPKHNTATVVGQQST